jgi:hypothetical protein
MSLFGLPTEFGHIADRGFKLAERAVEALEATAVALTRQAAVMESDVEAELPQTVDETWVRRYGEALANILDADGIGQFEKAKNLRNLSITMTKHGEEKRAQA